MAAFTTTITLDTETFLLYFDSLRHADRLMKANLTKDNYEKWRDAHILVRKQFIENSDPQSIKDFELKKLEKQDGIAETTPTITAPVGETSK